MKLVTNHWGWSPRGVYTWLRYGWAWPMAAWGVEHDGRFERHMKIGPVAFSLGWSRRT